MDVGPPGEVGLFFNVRQPSTPNYLWDVSYADGELKDEALGRN